MSAHSTDLPIEVLQGFKKLMDDHEELSDLIMRNNGLGVKLKELCEKARVDAAGPNDEPSVWLRNFIRALEDEVRELKASVAWKWWKTKERTDLRNVRVEIVDILHFLLSAASAAGMTSYDLVYTYYQKRALNFDRQRIGFIEGDNENRGIGEIKC